MKHELMLCAALAAAPFLRAQDDKAAPAMPNPKTEAHAALAMFVGDWTNTCHVPAGTPGAEQADGATGREHTELICDGLWSKTTFHGVHEGAPFEGLWLVGYDPTAQKYRGIWACGLDEPLMECDGSYDAASKTWTFTGDSPHGPFRSVVTFTDADHFAEVVYLVEDGKETEAMRMERTRRKGAGRTAEASAAPAKWPSPAHALLAEGVGEWTATTTCSVPGAPAVTEQGRETVVPICGGKWFWSDFTGTMMGAPFRGHCLTGHDAATDRYVSIWIDSMSPLRSRCEGTYDADEKAWTFTGSCLDMTGKPATIHQTYTQSNADTRDLQMTLETAEGKQEMKIHYERAGR